jgi:hypothetical protein
MSAIPADWSITYIGVVPLTYDRIENIPQFIGLSSPDSP